MVGVKVRKYYSCKADNKGIMVVRNCRKIFMAVRSDIFVSLKERECS